LLRLLRLILTTWSTSASTPVTPAVSTVLEAAVAISAVAAIITIVSITSISTVGPVASITVLLLALALTLVRLDVAARIALRIIPRCVGAIRRAVRAWRGSIRAPRRASVALIGARRRRWGGPFSLWWRASIRTRRRRRFDLDGALLAHGFLSRTALGVVEIRVVRRLGVGRVAWTFPASATWGASTFVHAVVE
jgi:hypothetical protein